MCKKNKKTTNGKRDSSSWSGALRKLRFLQQSYACAVGRCGRNTWKRCGDGNSNMFCFHLDNWQRFSIWRAYFSDGLKPPTCLWWREFSGALFQYVEGYILIGSMQIFVDIFWVKCIARWAPCRHSQEFKWQGVGLHALIVSFSTISPHVPNSLGSYSLIIGTCLKIDIHVATCPSQTSSRSLGTADEFPFTGCLHALQRNFGSHPNLVKKTTVGW